MFIDKARIYVTAGRGGAGCISFRREKYIPFGGPDGGNGGKGGDVYFYADQHMNTLTDLTFKPHHKAESGGAGSSSNKYGRGAPDLTIKVPVGTIVHKGDEIIADLREPGQTVLIARGGRGGRGNAAFKTSRHTAPRIAEKGEPGEDMVLDLELRLIADVGLVGFPNAGKSTFLSCVSAARPKIADYPFTTITPNLGVVSFGDRNIVIADIPGLIEGAHQGKGLGDEFLRHIQRTRVIVHLVDIFGFEGKDAAKNFRIINRELEKYSKALAKKPMIIAANKMDLTDAAKKLAAFRKKIGKKKVYPISAAAGKGVRELLVAVIKALETAPEDESLSDVSAAKHYTYEPEFTVEKIGDVFEVRGAKIEKLAVMTDFGQEEALMRFQNILKKMGVEEALQKKGILPGDTVRIGTFEFDYER